MAKKGLKTWFKENWVDLSTGKKCGRKSAKSSKRKYPVCRPKAVADKMTAGQKAAAIRRKRAKTNVGPKPTSIRTLSVRVDVNRRLKLNEGDRRR